MKKNISIKKGVKDKRSPLNKVDIVFRTIMNIVLVIYVLSLLVPIIWMVFTSCKTYSEYYTNTFLWPKKWTFANFGTAWNKLVITVIKDNQLIGYDVWDMAGISVIYAFGKAFICTLIHAMCAYVISRYKFKFCEFLYALGIFVMVTPIIGSGVSAMVVKKALGIYDNLLLTILTSCHCGFSGFYFILLYGSFKGIPKSYDEAAFLDGASHWQVMFKIVFPLILPICAVVFVLLFLAAWNDYGTFLIWLPSYPNLAYGVYKFQYDAQSYDVTINEVMAGFAVIMIPTMILYLCCNKLIVSKFTVGGLKG